MVAKRTTSRAVKRVAKSVTAVGASGGSAVTPSDIKAAVGTSTNPTSAGTKSVTGVGFQPKVLLPFTALGAVDGTAASAYFGVGASDGTTEGAASAASTSGKATSETQRRHASKAVSYLRSAVTSAFDEATVSSFDSDGFTLDWSGNLSNALILNHICLGGDDLEASLTLHQMNGTNADESFAHGLTGGAPDALLFFGGSINTVPATSSYAIATIGAWATTGQFNARVMSAGGQSTSDTARELRNDAVCSHGPTTLRRAFGVSSVDSINVDVTYVETGTTYDPLFFMLALRGCKAQVGTFDCNGSTAPLTISTPGITPKLFLPVYMKGAVSNLGTVQQDAILNIGASDGTNTVSCGVIDVDGNATTSSRRWQDSDELREYNAPGFERFTSAVSFGEESIVVNPSVVITSAWGQGAYLVIGN